jgi:fluoroquinolone resistance protein
MPTLQHFNEPDSDYYDQVFECLDLSDQLVDSNEFDDCSFVNCNFYKTDFQYCRFYNCHFENCNLSLAKINECRFISTLFKESNLMGINWMEADWPKRAPSCPIQFDNCIINYSIFINMNLMQIIIKECQAKSVDFENTDLTNANFEGTDLAGSNFVNTNITMANFAGAKNYNINLKLNNSKKTKFSLPEALSLLYSLNIELIEPT